MSHINNGLMTKIWGPHMWFAINCVSFGYPVNPTQEQKRQYKTFFEFLGFVLPCEFCKISYQFFGHLTHTVKMSSNCQPYVTCQVRDSCLE